MVYQFEIVKTTAQPMVSIRESTTPDCVGSLLRRLYGEIGEYLASHHLRTRRKPSVIYHQHHPERVDLEAVILLDAPATGDGRVKSGMLPAGKAAMTWHVGPYDDLLNALMAFADWAEAQQIQCSGVYWEVAMTNSGEEPDPANWRTQLFFPIA